ncbi:MAG: DUF6197 family protein [bacterium]
MPATTHTAALSADERKVVEGAIGIISDPKRWCQDQNYTFDAHGDIAYCAEYAVRTVWLRRRRPWPAFDSSDEVFAKINLVAASLNDSGDPRRISLMAINDSLGREAAIALLRAALEVEP